MLELQKIACFAKDFGNFCFRKNNVDPPVANIFRKNFLLSGKFFSGGGPGMEGGPNLGIQPNPPTGNRFARH